MFDIGWSELLVVGVVSLIVVGPKDLPGMFRSLGRITAKARSMAREFSRAMEDAADGAGIKDAAKDFKDLTSKKSLGLDKLEQVASNFEKWEPKLPSGLKAPSGPPGLQPDPDAPTLPTVEEEAAEDVAEAALSAPKAAAKPARKTARKAAAKVVESPAAVKSAEKVAEKTSAKAAPKASVKAAKPAAKAEGKATPKSAPKAAEKVTAAKTTAPKTPATKPSARKAAAKPAKASGGDA